MCPLQPLFHPEDSPERAQKQGQLQEDREQEELQGVDAAELGPARDAMTESKSPSQREAVQLWASSPSIQPRSSVHYNARRTKPGKRTRGL